MNEKLQKEVLDTLLYNYITKTIGTDGDFDFFGIIKDYPLEISSLLHLIPHTCCLKKSGGVLLACVERYPKTLEAKNTNGETPIFTAIRNSYFDAVPMLIENKVNLKHQNRIDETILHILCLLPFSTEKIKCLKLIVEMENELVNTKNMFFEFPIHYAARSGDIKTAEYLISKGALVQIQTIQLLSVVDYAYESHNLGMIDTIKKAIAEKSSEDGPNENELGSMTSSKYLLVENFYARDEITLNQLISYYKNYKTTGFNFLRKVKHKFIADEQEFINDCMELLQRTYTDTMLNSPNLFGPNKKYRIISLDGGGIKVMMQIVVLMRLSQKYPSMFEDTNLYCGCSASSAIVCSLAIGHSIHELYELFEHVIRFSFRRNSFQPVTTAKYSADFLKLFADCAFSDLPIKNVPRHIVIPSFLMDSATIPRFSESVVFTNLMEGNESEYVKDVCLRSAAAPTYYKPYENYLDGGLIDNNPVGCAFPLLIGEKGIGINPKDIVCLSISSGLPAPGYVDYEKIGNGGLVNWATEISDAFLLARRSESVKECQRMLGDRFFRLDPKYETKIDLDNVEQIDLVRRIAENYPLDELEKWMDKYWV